MIYEQEGLDDDEKEFLARWDLHVMAEHYPQGRYISDSLVRFVRREKIWLRQTHIWRELQKLIRELKDHNVIDSKVAAGCFKILWNDDAAEVGANAAGDPETKGVPANGEVATFGNGDRGPGRPGDVGEDSSSLTNGKMFPYPEAVAKTTVRRPAMPRTTSIFCPYQAAVASAWEPTYASERQLFAAAL